jgi:DNA invertase Pin-like site-specific DNA recombinase
MGKLSRLKQEKCLDHLDETGYFCYAEHRLRKLTNELPMSNAQYLIYARKSTDDSDNQKNSIDYQISQSLHFAQNHDRAIAPLTIEGFCEDGIIKEKHTAFKTSGITMKKDGTVQYRIERPKFQRMVELLINRQFSGVLCLCWDRLSRNDADGMIIKNLMDNGVDVRFVQAHYEKSSSGALHRDIDGMFAQHYSRVISEKVKAASEKLRHEGKCLYPSPIGYLDNGSSDKPIDTGRAPIIKRLFERYATGQWGLAQLAKWANRQGLTTKPTRRKRTQEEILAGVDPGNIPKTSRPVNNKTIENILNNPFYIGKLKTSRKGLEYLSSTSHQAIIDVSLFNRVQEILKQKNVSVYYVDKQFFTYRGFVRCTCSRLYTPYKKKGFTYYRVKCVEGCINTVKNLKESDIDAAISTVLSQIHFSDEELREIEAGAETGLERINVHRGEDLDALHTERKRIYDDLTYLTKNKITLLRNNAMSVKAMAEEERRLNGELERIDAKLKAHQQTAQEMLKFVITFSELVKTAHLYYKNALDSEKQEVASQVFSELTFKGGKLANYTAKESFSALLKRHDLKSGSADYLFSELRTVYFEVTLADRELKKLFIQISASRLSFLPH